MIPAFNWIGKEGPDCWGPNAKTRGNAQHGGDFPSLFWGLKCLKNHDLPYITRQYGAERTGCICGDRQYVNIAGFLTKKNQKTQKKKSKNSSKEGKKGAFIG